MRDSADNYCGDRIAPGSNIICSWCEDRDPTQYYDGDANCAICMAKSRELMTDSIKEEEEEGA